MKRTTAVGLLMAIVGGCTCSDGPGIGRADGMPELDPSAVDFGRVRLDETKRVEVRLFNKGSARLRIESIERVGLDAAFRLSQPPKEVPSAGFATLALTFVPDRIGALSGSIVLKTNSSSRPEVRLDLRGEGVETSVRIEPESIDFGLVEVDTKATRNLLIVNEGSIAEDVELVAAADGSPHFSVGDVGDAGLLHLEPGASVELPVSFRPLFADAAAFYSSVELRPCPTCATVAVPLRGIGVDAFLDVTPRDCLDFGLVNPGSELTKTVAVRNVGNLGLQILASEIADGAGSFTVGGDYPTAIAGGASVVVPVTYRPTELRTHNGRLVVRTDDPRRSSIDICLRGTGGGPDVSVTPAAVDFGTVAVGATRSKTVRIANTGLGSPAASTPLVITKATITGAGGPFTVTFPQPITIDLGRAATLPLVYAPTAEASDADVLVLETNDSDSPTVSVALSGKGRALPPCQLTTIPANGTLAFGNVDRGRRAVLPFALRNSGTDDCIVDTLALDEASDPVFTLVDGAVDERVLRPGDTWNVAVAFQPLERRAFTGRIKFNVNDPQTPARSVALRGVSAQGCLLVAPDEVDFGTVGANCASRESTITVYNVCTNPVKVTALGLVETGEPYFQSFGTPTTFPVSLTSSNSLTFRLRYRPTQNGEHHGGFLVTSDERPEPYLVALMGRAADDAIQTDTFKQEDRPKVDLLFVVDNSGSMSEEQAALAANFADFMTFANAQQVDYHIAVTTTDVDSGGEQGRFVPLDNSRPRILTPLTPNVAAVFAENVNVGTSGSADEKGLEGAYRALNPAALAGPNAGFLRDDAMLSVIIVSDEQDYSPQDLNFYMSFFLNIKGARRANMFSLSAIVDPNEGYNWGIRYMEAARRSGGIFSDIATDDWSRDLKELGALAFGYKNRFGLTSTPAAVGEIEVSIDQDLVPQVEGTIRNWDYEREGNAVEFSPVAIPEPGSNLTVRYRVACGG